MIKSGLVETLGTFAILFFTSKITLSSTPLENQETLFQNALSLFFITLGTMYMGVTKSGSQFNPMFTTALLIIKEIDIKIFIVNIIGQILGSTLAHIVTILINDQSTIFLITNENFIKIILIEIFVSFFLTSFYLFTFINKKSAKGSYAFTIAGAYAFFTICIGPFHFSRFNLVFVLMPSVVGMSLGGKVYSVVAGNFLGGLLAAVFYKVFYESDLRKDVEIVVDESEQEVRF